MYTKWHISEPLNIIIDLLHNLLHTYVIRLMKNMLSYWAQTWDPSLAGQMQYHLSYLDCCIHTIHAVPVFSSPIPNHTPPHYPFFPWDSMRGWMDLIHGIIGRYVTGCHGTLLLQDWWDIHVYASRLGLKPGALGIPTELTYNSLSTCTHKSKHFIL